MLIPILFGKRDIVGTVEFKPNLNLHGEPAYMNEGCNIGIVRVPEGTYKGRLVYMIQDEFWPTANRAEFISEREAYELCVQRGKYDVIKEYDIKPEY